MTAIEGGELVMPQATDELRETVAKIIPGEHDGLVDCGVAQEWLEARGWQFSRTGWMRSPGPVGQVPRDEFDVALYLVHEWDYAYEGEIK